MKHKRNEGFTLVELLVTIVIASVVTMAATTVLLLGIRLNNSSSATAQRQNTVRIFLSVVEKMATEGTLGEITTDSGSWKIKAPGEPEESGRTLFSYNGETGTISSGDTPLMEDVVASYIVVEGDLLTVGVETEDGSYTTSVYCRSGAALTDKTMSDIVDENGELPSPSTEVVGKEGRMKLLKVLLSQRGSTGMILKEIDGTMIKTPLYYAEWYDERWPIDTPWCGCFLSWALKQEVGDNQKVSDYIEPSDHEWYLKFADVDNCEKFFKDSSSWKNPDDFTPAPSEFTPAPGDIIFFDWTREQKDPAHVGVVLAVKDDYVYTIEGNSVNMVAVRKYKTNDDVIMGYGILDWKLDSEP